MVTLQLLIHAAQAAAASHHEAIQNTYKVLSWISKAGGLLRTLDWARNKYLPKSKKPEQAENQRTTA
jgi:hypothetical protein